MQAFLSAPNIGWFLPPSSESLVRNLPSFSLDAGRFIILGPLGSGTTSLLTRLAFSLALKDKRVLLLMDKERFEDSDFATPDNRDDPRFDNISIKYVSSFQDIIRWTNCCQRAPKPYHAILVDGLSHLLQSSTNYVQDYTRLVACLHESALYMSQLLSQSRPTQPDSPLTHPSPPPET